LEAKGISCEVINIHTIKPLDDKIILDSVAKTKCIVVAEEHQKLGGLGGSISTLLAEKFPAPIEFVAVDDKFGESGKPSQLMEKYGLSASNIVSKVNKCLARKS